MEVSLCFIKEICYCLSSLSQFIGALFRNMVKTVMKSGTKDSQLHLKILSYHDDRVREGTALQLELLELKQVHMPVPREWFLNKLDPRGDLLVPDLRDLLHSHLLEYKALVLLDHVDPGMTVKKALAIHKKWHVLNQQPT